MIAVGKHSWATERDLRSALQKRKPESTKLDNGRLVVIGGSENFHGAPALASNAAHSLISALRIGTGYACAYVPKQIVSANRKVSPDVIIRSMKGSHLSMADVNGIMKGAAAADSIVIGPGLGRSSGSKRAALRIIKQCERLGKRVVIDADAIYAVRGAILSSLCMLTPNEREFRMLNGPLPKGREGRIAAVVGLSRKMKCMVLLKGRWAVVTDGKRIKLSRPASTALATMGTGDVLSGMIGAFASFNADLFAASVAAVYLGTRIGGALHRKMGDHILASDVYGAIPSSLKRISR